MFTYTYKHVESVWVLKLELVAICSFLLTMLAKDHMSPFWVLQTLFFCFGKYYCVHWVLDVPGTTAKKIQTLKQMLTDFQRLRTACSAILLSSKSLSTVARVGNGSDAPCCVRAWRPIQIV